MVMSEKFKINRAPVLTLWATVVAEKLGYNREEALTLGRAVAGLNAQSKGRRLGIYEPPKEEEKTRKERELAPFQVELLGRSVPAEKTEQGVRALEKGKPVRPQAVEQYLETKFKDRLPEARAVMEDLAGSFTSQELSRRAYALYEKFRPVIPEGTRGWGASGELDLEGIRSLKKQPAS